MSGEARRELHLVTGGCGYAGYNLARRLISAGHDVRMFDVQQPIWPALENAEIITGDIRNLCEVEAAFESVDCVYHLASYGMSGREQLNKKLIEEVNVLGTKNVIKACCNKGVKRLVYTSTYNVVFGGQVIVNGDESLPYLPLHKHPDHYSRTKSIAEKEIIEANGSVVTGGGTLRTCALRLAGVYGPGEQRHLPRIVGYLELGLFSFIYGDPSNRVDFLHIDNLVEAHYLAGLALTDDRKHVAAGQVYFISDNKPVNNFEFFRPLVEGLGYEFPRIKLPIMLIYFFAYITEWVHFLVGRLYNFQPILTRTEVYKTGVTHFFNTEKARQELGYAPQRQNDITGAVEHFQKLGRVNSKRKHSSGLWTVFLNLALVCLAVAVVMAFMPIVT